MTPLFLSRLVQAMGYDVEHEGSLDQPNPMEERILFEYSQKISHLAAKQSNLQQLL